MKFIKEHFNLLIIIVLMIIIFWQRFIIDYTEPLKPTIVTDTVYERYDSIIHTKPKIIHSKPIVDIQYLPSPDYEELVKQYKELSKNYLTKNTYKDSISLDKFGDIVVVDTVFKNNIIDRSYKYNLNIPTVTIKETSILKENSKLQVYIGGALQGQVPAVINQINVGLLVKNKKDQIYGIYAGPNFKGEMNYGVQLYWKIKLKK